MPGGRSPGLATRNGGNVPRPRAADDFPMIRARMEELRRERARPRAADDFPRIRARMEELRRERALLPNLDALDLVERDVQPFANAQTPSENMFESFLAPTLEHI